MRDKHFDTDITMMQCGKLLRLVEPCYWLLFVGALFESVGRKIPKLMEPTG